MMANRNRPYLYRALGVVLALLIAASCWSAINHIPESFRTPYMTSLSPRLQPLFEKTKAVCVGQFLVDVPASATVIYGAAEVPYPTWHYPNEAAKIQQHVEKQLAKVEEDREYLDPRHAANFPMFGKVIDGAVPGQKLVFGSRNHVHYTITSFVSVGKDLYVQESDGASPKNQHEFISEINNFAKQVRLRAENEIPTEVGSCIQGGFVAWQPDYEMVQVGIRLKEFPDVHFSIEVHRNPGGLPEINDLERRLKEAEADAPHGIGSWYSRIKFLRRGARQLGQWKGYEALARLPAQEHEKETHEFQFHSLGAVDDSLHPELDMQLDTGVVNNRKGAVKPSISDEEAVALWDKLSTSFRVRPTNATKTSAPDQVKVPLGELSATGRACPQSGWWQCKEFGEVDDGRRRHFKKGEVFPKVVLLGKPTIWQKLKGQRPTYPIDTVWEFAESDS